MILAMNGADFGYLGEFGAASQPILDLQTALATLGKGIGDNSLSKLSLDGLIGPKTTAATNRALTVHLGTGQAPANLRTGSLSQAVVVSQAPQITQLILAEITRRGFNAPTKKALPKKAVAKAAPSTYTAPAAMQYTPPAPAAAIPSPVYRVPAMPSSAAASSDSMASIMKWSAIGVGAVTLLGLGYWLMTRKQGARPAMAGLGALPTSDRYLIEGLMDKSGGVSDVFEAISEIASEKAEHVRMNWQDTRLARRWQSLGRRMDKLAASTKNFEVQ
jgi:hypothetical protein